MPSDMPSDCTNTVSRARLNVIMTELYSLTLREEQEVNNIPHG
jgi:hypothetical protein